MEELSFACFASGIAGLFGLTAWLFFGDRAMAALRRAARHARRALHAKV